MLKSFKYDVLVGEEDICGRDDEKGRLLDGISRGRRMVVYARRRFGKTSLVKNVVAPSFRHSADGIYLYADLYQVCSLEDISRRLQIGISQMMRAAFPVKSLAKALGNYFRGVSPQMTFDPYTGRPSFSLEFGEGPVKPPALAGIFEGLRGISKDKKLLIILDEFQSIADVDQAEGLLRSELMACQNVAVVLLGSRRHILRDIFSDPERPFYNFGSDIELKAISFESYAPYIRERLEVFNLAIDDETLSYWLHQMNNIPNSINELGAWMTDHYAGLVLTKDIIRESIGNMVEEGEVRFSTLLDGCSRTEILLLVALAKLGPMQHLLSEQFSKASRLKIPTIQKVRDALLKKGLIEEEEGVTFVSDPLLQDFLRYRR